MAIKASEVARRIGVKTGTLGKWRRQGKGPKGWYALSATVVVYPETEVQKFLREQQEALERREQNAVSPVRPEEPKR
ncbi:MAG TPA: transposase [Thermoanaerobaculia bacterium]|jgi:transposase-like protein|nr:transposase [Thermoanaerobaculia bacterium]HQR67126.1 transposase [Thermoanaerobaculia bacterium]